MLLALIIILAADALLLIALLLRQQTIHHHITHMAKTQTELAAELAALSAKTDKIAAEQRQRFDDLTAVINRLTEQVNAGTVTPEVEASLNELATKLASLDDTIPDAPAPEA